jgi:TonB family protein
MLGLNGKGGLRAQNCSVIAVLLSCLLAPFVQANPLCAQDLHFVQHHFGLTVPSGWTRLPDATVKAIWDTGLATLDLNLEARLVAGFGPAGHGISSLDEYILVAAYEGGRLDPTKLADMVSATPERLSAIADQIGKNARVLAELSPGQFVYDSTRLTLWQRVGMTLVGGRRVSSVAAGRLSAQGWVQAVHYTTSDDASEGIMRLVELVESITFDRGYGYRDAEPGVEVAVDTVIVWLDEDSPDPRDPEGRTLSDADAGRLFPDAVVDERPQMLRCPTPPAYDPSLGEGQFVLQFVIDTLGVVEPGNVEVIESTNPALDSLALEFIRRCRFRPGRLVGRAVRVLVQWQLGFGVP